MRADFLFALQMHPLVFMLPAAVPVYLLRKRLPRKVLIVLCVVALLIMFVTYIYRLSSGSEIVYADFERGGLYKMLQNFTVEG